MATDPLGFRAGLDIAGGGPASRETALLSTRSYAETINAVLFSGGSAFGLDAAGGVMQYMEEHGMGFDVGMTKVPLVCQSSIFDLRTGDYRVRPDKEMGYKVCEAAMAENYRDGRFGAGTGALVANSHGLEEAMPSGVGSYAVKVGDLMVGAVVVLNAYGDIYDFENGKLVKGHGDALECLGKESGLNTTLGAVITNAYFEKPKLEKIAAMTQDGYARCIKPVHTNYDGDSIYAISTGDVKSDVNFTGSLAAEVMAKAILIAACPE